MKTYTQFMNSGCHITAVGSYVQIALDFPREHAHSCLRQLCGTRWLVALLIVALLLVGCGKKEQSTDSKIREITIVNASDIAKLRQRAVNEDKVLVIDCWATWCGSCVAMFPKLHEAMKERGDGVLLVSMSFDEGEDLAKRAAEFLTKQNAWDNAYLAASGSDASDAIAKALSDHWNGGVLPAVFVYKPDGSTAYELLETRGEVADWVAGIAEAVDQAMKDAEGSPGE